MLKSALIASSVLCAIALTASPASAATIWDIYGSLNPSTWMDEPPNFPHGNIGPVRHDEPYRCIANQSRDGFDWQRGMCRDVDGRAQLMPDGPSR